MNTRIYRERQWRSIELPPDVLAVPSMLSVDERRLLFSLARDSFSGAGAIVDAGCFLGGSTLALGAGLLANSRVNSWAAIDSYDMFVLDEYMLKHYVHPHTVGEYKPNDSCRDLFDHNISSISSIVNIHHGDIREIGWGRGPIEILFLDILKAPNTNDCVIRDFFSSLIPGRSVLVQQDYIHEVHFWIHITMEILSEYFTYTEFVEYSSTIYLLRKPIPQHVIDECMWNASSKDEKFRIMDNAISRWQGYEKGVLECARAFMRAWFGDRDGALEDLARIRDDYYWSDYVLTRADWNRDVFVRIPNPVDPAYLPTGFDATTYLALNKDVANAGMDPVQHYLTYGHREGRPKPLDPAYLPAGFDAKTYLALHKDVANAGIDPVQHYLTYGHRESRRVR